VLDVDLPVAVDVVCDMVTSSLIAASDVDNERGVILDEIAMHDDDPGDAVFDAFAAAVWPGDPLGRPVLGTVPSIESMSRAAVAGYYRRRYRPASLVVTAAGNVDHAALVRLVRRAFAAVPVDDDAAPAGPRGGAARPPRFVPATAVVDRPTEQANLILGLPAFGRRDRRRFALDVLSAALGGGMSSRLFQEIRERRGLAYSVYSFTSHYADTGVVGVHAGCHPAKAARVLDLCRSELAAVAASGLGAEEVERGKGQVRGGFVLGLEDTGSRMSRLGKAELDHGELMSVDEVLAAIESVSAEDVNGLAAELFGGPAALTVIGPYDDDRAFAA
jgi:predicted Zn-dependent peptidase